MCDRVHQSVSLELDGELSPFERVLLRSHLRTCSACRAYAQEVGDATRAIRSTPLEALPHPIALPSRRRFGARTRLVGVAAAAVVTAVGIGGIASSLGREAPPSAPTATPVVAGDDALVREFQRQSLATMGPRQRNIGFDL